MLYITPSHYHHCANLSEDIELIKFLSDLFCRVWVRWGIFSQLSIIQYVWLCVCSLPVSLVMIERIYILCLIIIIKSEVWTVTHCLWLGHETMLCAVCLSTFLFLSMRYSVKHLFHICLQRRHLFPLPARHVILQGFLVMSASHLSSTESSVNARNARNIINEVETSTA